MSEDYRRLDRESRAERPVRDHTHAWEKLRPLSAAPAAVLDRVEALCREKRITRAGLEALGVRIAMRRGGGAWLAFAGTNGNGVVTAIKYRPLGGSSHDSEAEKPSTWLRPIIIGRLDGLDWFVAEGETDAARLYDLVGDIATILCLPTGTRAEFRREWAALIPRGATVYLAHDADKDGDQGAATAAAVIGGRTVRVRPPDDAKDWCEWPGDRDAFVALVREARSRVRVEGLSHLELLATEIAPAPQLVEGIVEAGTVGTIAGLPETYKSFSALAITLRVAKGSGSVFGREVLRQGPCSYWWSDDSVENEVRRVQSYAQRHAFVGNLPITWHLNSGLLLPAGIAALREEVEDKRLTLLCLDSLYNFLPPTIRLKDEEVAVILAELKREVADPFGCTILVVDHSPWPSESNQGQRRAFGSVFKAACVRFRLFFDRVGDTVFVEAHGNNLAGLPRTPAVWDAEEMELRIVQAPSESDDLGDRLAEFLSRNPGATTTVIQAAVTGKEAAIKKRLESDERFTNVPAVLFGKPKNSRCWVLAEDVQDLLHATSAQDGAEVGRTLPPETDEDLRPEVERGSTKYYPSPRRRLVVILRPLPGGRCLPLAAAEEVRDDHDEARGHDARRAAPAPRPRARRALPAAPGRRPRPPPRVDEAAGLRPAPPDRGHARRLDR